MFNRRQVIQMGLSTASVGTSTIPSFGDDSGSPNNPIIDTNAHLFHWPFRRLPLDSTPRLVSKFRSLGITQAWASSFEGVLHRDLTSVNDRLAAECAAYKELLPIGVINLNLPGWEGDLEHCFSTHNMPGIRIYPGYHQYNVDDSRLVDLLNRTADAGRFAQVVVALEDARTQHPLAQVPEVNLSVFAELLSGMQGISVQLLNARISSRRLSALASVRGLHVDTARVESTDGVPRLTQQMPQGRVLFGTHAPFLIPEAALIRTHESGVLGLKALRSLFFENAQQLLVNWRPRP